MSKRILAVDPSGTGTTGIFFKSEAKEQFISCQDPCWIKHFEFILDLVEKYQPNLLLFENSNYVSLRGKDMTYLWKLLGTIEALPYRCSSIEKLAEVPVNQVKGLRSKLLKGKAQIPELEYRKGIGWHHNRKKISTHELDAYLVYWLWENKENDKQKTSPLGKVLKPNKVKQNIKRNYYETN